MRKQAIQRLEKAAREGNWDYVDATIPKLVGDRKYAHWAFENEIQSPEENIRDLGASIIEKTSLPEEEFAPMRDGLADLMLNRGVKYDKFRAACALAAHQPGRHGDAVRRVLGEFQKDPDVKDIAVKYLKKFTF